MIDNDAWANILATASDFSVVCEIYPADQTPTASGFDPADAIGRYAAVSGIEFAGEEYECLVRKFGNVSRTIRSESNSASVEFSNLDNQISNFEFTNGFEGLIKVVRLISRSQSTSIALSQILFTGVCEKPQSGTKAALSVKSNWILHGLDVQIPRRKYTKEDQEGRVPTDPEFEGFPFIPQTGTTSYSVRNGQKRGGIAGFFGFKKTAFKTLQWSSFSDLDANKVVPEVFGVAQIMVTHIGYADVGTQLRMRSAVSEGPIHDIINTRSTDTRLPLNALSYAECYGLVGAANGDDPSWVAPGYYSRTAYIRCQADNSTVEAEEAAPEVVCVVYGRLVTIPDASGDWVLDEEFSDNAAAHTWFIFTSPDYFKLDPNWINPEDAHECYLFNDEKIIDRSLSDFIFAVEG